MYPVFVYGFHPPPPKGVGYVTGTLFNGYYTLLTVYGDCVRILGYLLKSFGEDFGVMVYARYTFFDIACDNGVIVSTFRDLIPRHHELRIVTHPQTQTRDVFLFKNGEQEPYFSLAVPMRTTVESHAVYHDRLREAVKASWKAYKGESTTGSGRPSSEKSDSTTSPPIASSIIPPTEPGQSRGESDEQTNSPPPPKEPEPQDSAPVIPTSISKKSTRTSTRSSRVP